MTIHYIISIDRRRYKMSNGINFVNACSGGLSFRIQTAEGEIGRRADTVEDGVYFINKYGISPSCYFSSDMDFATEEGFATDDGAKRMWKEITEFACEVA